MHAAYQCYCHTHSLKLQQQKTRNLCPVASYILQGYCDMNMTASTPELRQYPETNNNNNTQKLQIITPDPGGIGHGALCVQGQVQSRSRCGEQRWGRNWTGPQEELPRAGGRTSRKMKACQHGHGRRQVGAHGGQRTTHLSHAKGHTFVLHASRGRTI